MRWIYTSQAKSSNECSIRHTALLRGKDVSYITGQILVVDGGAVDTWQSLMGEPRLTQPP